MKKRIKILFYIETLKAGGAEKVLCNLVNNMDQDKFDITVQTTWKCDEKLIAKGVSYKYIFSKQNLLTSFIVRLEAALKLLYRLHLKDDYDIEVAYLESFPTKVIASSTNKNSVKLAWVHCDLSRSSTNVDELVNKTASWYEKFDKVVCVSEDVRDSFLKLYGKNCPTAVIYNVIDDEEIRRKSNELSKDPINKTRLTSVFVGRLSPQKNIYRLLAAHKRLVDEGVNCDLWIVGEGPERGEIEKYIKFNNLSNSVVLFGQQDNPYPYMREADILVCSSDYEGYSTAVTEGLILGKPIVTTDVSGMHELLGDSQWGLVTEIDDDEFYNGLHRMLTHEHERNRFALASKERGTFFNKDKLAKNKEEFFLSLMSKN